VLVLVLLESCVIAGVGGLVGLGLAWTIISSGNPAPSLLPRFYLPSHDLIIGLVVIIALGFIAGVVPALQAMRLRIAVALRRNG
jgi:putative ABC transport system permease protein